MALQEGKLYYSISEVAQHVDVATSLLRYWETEFQTLQPKRNGRGKRFYTNEDIALVERIYFLVKVKGYTLQGAKDKLKTDKKTVDTSIQILEKLQNVKNFLTKLRAEI